MPDGTPQRRRRRRKCVGNEGDQPESSKGARVVDGSSEEDTGLSSQAPMPMRECPVPKPRGLVGEILGFKPSSSEEERGRPP
jgi:cytochrome c oxidase assembly factor 2